MKTIELIDKYEIRQSDDPDYNPPNYRWIDNTGELIRCGECKYYSEAHCVIDGVAHWRRRNEDDYCSLAEREES